MQSVNVVYARAVVGLGKITVLTEKRKQRKPTKKEKERIRIAYTWIKRSEISWREENGSHLVP
jgi:hypothetical protein